MPIAEEFNSKDVRRMSCQDRLSLAERDDTLPSILQILSESEEEHVRKYVANNTRTPVETLRSLANDPSEDVRGWLAMNTNTPADVLERLASEAVGVRFFVAGNENTSLKLLERLRSDTSEDVRRAVIENRKAPDSWFIEKVFSYDHFSVIVFMEERVSGEDRIQAVIGSNSDNLLAEEDLWSYTEETLWEISINTLFVPESDRLLADRARLELIGLKSKMGYFSRAYIRDHGTSIVPDYMLLKCNVT